MLVHVSCRYLNKQFVKQKRSSDAENYAPPSQMLPANNGNSVMEVGQVRAIAPIPAEREAVCHAYPL